MARRSITIMTPCYNEEDNVLNVYNQGNVDGLTYDYNYTHMAYANDLPIIPSIGLRVEY